MRKQSLVTRFGSSLPAGVSKADAEAVLQFLYGAFDRRMARQVRILHPYSDESEGDASLPELSVFDFCRWLQVATA